MKKSFINLLIPTILLVGVVGLASCKKNREVKALITVLHDTVSLGDVDTSGNVTLDSVTGPLVGAEVRMWSDQTGSLIDTTLFTNTSGQAEFEFDHVAILRLNVKHSQDDLDIGYVILEEGEVVEKTVNVDEY